MAFTSIGTEVVESLARLWLEEAHDLAEGKHPTLPHRHGMTVNDALQDVSRNHQNNHRAPGVSHWDHTKRTGNIAYRAGRMLRKEQAARH
jgi:hypothetical protein